VVEEEVEDDARKSCGDADAGVHPHDGGIAGGRNEGFADSGSDGGGEEVKRLDEGFHARWGFGVGVFETGDGDEDLSQTDENVGRRLHGDMDVVWKSATGGANACCAFSGTTVARAGAVDEVLNNGGVCKADGSEEETDRDASNRLELDLKLAEDGVDNDVQNRNEDDNGNGVEVLHQIVGHAVALHLASLGNEVA